MKKKMLQFLICLSFSQLVNAQSYFPNMSSQSEKNLKIIKVERNPSNTIVQFEYISDETTGRYVLLSSPNTSGAYYIQSNGIKFNLMSTEGIANKDGITAAYPNRPIRFSAIFEPLPSSIRKFDLIEGASGTWHFYGVELLSKSNATDINTDNSSITSPANSSASYYLVLTAKGFLRNKADVFADVIYEIPEGSQVGVYSKENSYFKVNFNGYTGYLSELICRSSNNSNAVNSSDASKEVQKKECKSFYKDGKTFQYYVHNGISITMHLSKEKNYGRYFIAYISIENLTGKSFNFIPDEITALYESSKKVNSGEVLSSDEYLRKVNNRQAWNAALMAFGETSSANQAGYSATSTTARTSSYSNSYGSASGYYGNTYGSVSGTSQTYGTSTTVSKTQSYNGAANYAAQQNARQNINNYQEQQYQIKSVLDKGYLKLNTIENEQRIVGQINIKYVKAENITVTIPVNGVNYEFLWSE